MKLKSLAGNHIVQWNVRFKLESKEFKRFAQILNVEKYFIVPRAILKNLNPAVFFVLLGALPLLITRQGERLKLVLFVIKIFMANEDIVQIYAALGQ